MSIHKYNYRRTWKEFGKRQRGYKAIKNVHFCIGWAGDGKFWKRKLHKYRRRQWKDEILRGRNRMRGQGIESECNWKTW